MTALIIILIAAIIFILMHLIAKKSKPLQYWVVSIAIAFLLASHFFQLEKNSSNLALIIALIIFGNFVRKPRTSI
jgi:chromate transport protein ChrA